MPESPARPPKPRQQVAALPFRRGKDGRLRIMLITSRDTRRWVIPKGWPIRGLKPHAAAAREALEEAGLVGQIAKRPFGSFLYEKGLEGGASVLCAVDVFPFKVKGQRKRWAEKGQRDGRWFDPGEAAVAVAEPDLRALIERFAETRPERIPKGSGKGGVKENAASKTGVSRPSSTKSATETPPETSPGRKKPSEPKRKNRRTVRPAPA